MVTNAALAEPAGIAAGTPLYRLGGVGYAIAGKTILDAVSLTLRPGAVHGLIGSNGSGKSTLVKILARQLAPSQGSVLLDGRPIAGWGQRELARTIAYMPQFTPPTEGMTVKELVALGRYPWHGALGRHGPADAARIDEAIESVGLSTLVGRVVDSLSGGERQRAWLALALAQDTRCILLDEPTSALDVANETAILALLRDLSRSRGIAVVVVLHDVNLAARICDEIIALRSGRVVAQAVPRTLMTPQTLQAVYGVPMGVIDHPLRGDPMAFIL